MAKKKFIHRLFSDQAYANLQLLPLMIILFPSMFVLFINFFYFVLIIVGYAVWVIALKYGKMSFEQKYKIYRFIDATIFDIDHHKALKGYIDVDISETYPLAMGTKDAIQLHLKKLEEDIQDYTKRRDKYKDMLKTLKQTKQPKEEEKEEEITEEEVEEDDVEEDIDYQDTEYKDIDDEELESDVSQEIDMEENEIEIDKETEKEIEETEIKGDEEKQIDEEVEKAISKLNVKKIEKKIKEFDIIIDQLQIEFETIETDTEQFEASLEKVKKEYGLEDDNWMFYRSKIAYSDVYSQAEEIIFILPTNFDETFNFTDDYGNYDGIWLNVPNYACATFVEVEDFKGIPYILCVCSSYWIKKSKLTTIKKEVAETLVLNAQFRYLADEISQIQNEYKTLQFDNLDLQNQATILLDQIKRSEKRHKVQTKQLLKEKKIIWDTPPKKLYALTIVLFILGLILGLIFGLIFSPMVFYQQPISQTIESAIIKGSGLYGL